MNSKRKYRIRATSFSNKETPAEWQYDPVNDMAVSPEFDTWEAAAETAIKLGLATRINEHETKLEFGVVIKAV